MSKHSTQLLMTAVLAFTVYATASANDALKVRESIDTLLTAPAFRVDITMDSHFVGLDEPSTPSTKSFRITFATPHCFSIQQIGDSLVDRFVRSAEHRRDQVGDMDDDDIAETKQFLKISLFAPTVYSNEADTLLVCDLRKRYLRLIEPMDNEQLLQNMSTHRELRTAAVIAPVLRAMYYQLDAFDFQYDGLQEMSDGRWHQFSSDEFPEARFEHVTIWIEEGERARPKRIVLQEHPMSKQMAQLVREQRNGDEAAGPGAAPNMYGVATLEFRSWHLFDEIPEEAFTMAVPPEYEEVESLRHLMLNSDVDPKALDRDPDAVLKLLGQPAPPFETVSLDEPDEPVSLPRDVDSVLIIDFWATWCAPCVRAMPDLIAVAEANADRGVALFAVNVGESRERIERFLQDHDWNVEILMDEESEIFQSFDGTSLPTTIVIDREGIVRQIHRGYSPELKDRLQSEIDEIVDEQRSDEVTE